MSLRARTSSRSGHCQSHVGQRLIVAVLALVAVLAVRRILGPVTGQAMRGGAISGKTQPTATLTPVPMPTPTPLPLAPAADDKTMIVILPFHSTVATDSEPHKKIRRRIQDLLAQMPNNSVTAVIDPNTVLTADQQAEAEVLGKRHNASMVIWGEDTGVELVASFLNLREPDFAAGCRYRGDATHAVGEPGSQYAEFVTRDFA